MPHIKFWQIADLGDNYLSRNGLLCGGRKKCREKSGVPQCTRLRPMRFFGNVKMLVVKKP